jgi:hypothetical protein
VEILEYGCLSHRIRQRHKLEMRPMLPFLSRVPNFRARDMSRWRIRLGLRTPVFFPSFLDIVHDLYHASRLSNVGIRRPSCQLTTRVFNASPFVALSLSSALQHWHARQPQESRHFPTSSPSYPESCRIAAVTSWRRWRLFAARKRQCRPE